MAYFPASCDHDCKDCSQNKCGWCAFYDRPTTDATGELASTAYQSATITNNTKNEAANKFAVLYDHGTCDGIAQDCFKAGAEWEEGQGVSMEITDETKWTDVDTFVHRNCHGATVIQIRKKEK